MARKAKAEHPASKYEDYGCFLRELPGEKMQSAVKYAVKENPANGMFMGLSSTLNMMSDGIITPQRASILISRYWGKGGVKLTVSFMSQASAALKDKILLYMNKWNKWANVGFTLASGNNPGDVRISLGGGGYWSYLGTDVRQIPKNQPTMNLQGFSLSTSEAEYDRVVTHETGHTLGMPHEHMRAAIINKLDYEKTIAYFKATQGWSRQDVINQVLTPLEEEQLLHTELAEDDSIMTYTLPASITKTGQPIKGGSKITDNDGNFCGKWYPKEVNPVDPDKPGPSVPDPVVIKIYGAKRIEIPGFVVRPQNSQSGGEVTLNVE